MKNLLLIACILSVFTLGCGLQERFTQLGSNTSPANSDATTNTASRTDAFPVSDDPRADVVQASKKFLDLPQFSARMEGRGTTKMDMQLDYVAPDRYHMVNLGGGEQPMSEFIIIGKDMYMKLGNRWQKMPGAVGNTMPNLRELFNEEGLKTLQDVKYVGDDVVDGKSTHIYSYRNSQTSANIPYTFTSKIWVGASDGLPHKIEVTYEQGELKTMTIDYDFNTNVSIEPPATK